MPDFVRIATSPRGWHPQYRPDSDHRVHCRITIISSCTDGVWRREQEEERRTIYGKNGTVVVHQYNRRADGGEGGGGSEWRSREGGLKASSLHFGSEHRRTNDVLIILGGGGAVFRAEQKLRTVKSDVQWELIGDEVVKGYITSICVYIYIYTKVEFNRGIGPLFNRITRYYYCITRRSIFNLSGNVRAYEY